MKKIIIIPIIFTLLVLPVFGELRAYRDPSGNMILVDEPSWLDNLFGTYSVVESQEFMMSVFPSDGDECIATQPLYYNSGYSCEKYECKSYSGAAAIWVLTGIVSSSNCGSQSSGTATVQTGTTTTTLQVTTTTIPIGPCQPTKTTISNGVSYTCDKNGVWQLSSSGSYIGWNHKGPVCFSMNQVDYAKTHPAENNLCKDLLVSVSGGTEFCPLENWQNCVYGCNYGETSCLGTYPPTEPLCNNDNDCASILGSSYYCKNPGVSGQASCELKENFTLYQTEYFCCDNKWSLKKDCPLSSNTRKTDSNILGQPCEILFYCCNSKWTKTPCQTTATNKSFNNLEGYECSLGKTYCCLNYKWNLKTLGVCTDPGLIINESSEDILGKSCGGEQCTDYTFCPKSYIPYDKYLGDVDDTTTVHSECILGSSDPSFKCGVSDRAELNFTVKCRVTDETRSRINAVQATVKDLLVRAYQRLGISERPPEGLCIEEKIGEEKGEGWCGIAEKAQLFKITGNKCNDGTFVILIGLFLLFIFLGALAGKK